MVMVPDCPLSQSYSTPFLRLKKKYENSLDFFLVVPAKFYQKNEIKNKRVKYIKKKTENISEALNKYKEYIKVIFHFGEYTIKQAKHAMRAQNIPIRV